MKSLFSFLYDNAEYNPNNTFVIDAGKEWSYSGVYEKTKQVGAYFKSIGIGAGDRVIIYLDNSVEYIICFYAILMLNAIIVPVNINTSIENISFIKEDVEGEFVISSKIFKKKINSNINKNILNIEDIMSEEYGFINEMDNNYKLEDEEQTALILYTSGTTKQPKGVTLTHKNLMSNTNSILEYLKLISTDSVLVTIPFTYSYGNSLLLTHSKIGGALYIEKRASYPIKILEQLQSKKITGFSTVGSYLNILLKQDSIKNIDLSGLKYMTFAGESISYDDIQILHNIAPELNIYIMYGQTEASARLSYLEPEMIFKKPGSIGRGIPGVELKVINEEGQAVEPGEIGEIIAHGDNIMKGYWNNSEETKEVIRDGWLYTGDLATVCEDGYIYIKGRKNDIIKYFGHRISPLEIEAALNTHKDVLESAVIEVEKENLKSIKAYIVLKNDTCTLDSINDHIRSLLPTFKRPQIIEFIAEIPRSVNGKIKRSSLRELSKE